MQCKLKSSGNPSTVLSIFTYKIASEIKAGQSATESDLKMQSGPLAFRPTKAETCIHCCVNG